MVSLFQNPAKVIGAGLSTYVPAKESPSPAIAAGAKVLTESGYIPVEWITVF